MKTIQIEEKALKNVVKQLSKLIDPLIKLMNMAGYEEAPQTELEDLSEDLTIIFMDFLEVMVDNLPVAEEVGLVFVKFMKDLEADGFDVKEIKQAIRAEIKKK